jgi:hypothetical protein
MNKKADALKKIFSVLALSLTLITLNPSTAMAADEAQGAGLIDDSIRDMTVVLGSGAVGAILGLSTLSFVEHPSDHWKNVAIGGAIGIVVGVGSVIFNAASRSSTMAIGQSSIVPLNPEKFATVSRHDFSNFRIAKQFFKEPSLGYTFQF